MKEAIKTEQFVIPEIYCPFPPAISPHYLEVQAHTQDWVHHFGLAQRETVSHYYHMADLPGLACRTYPKAELADLFLASDWLFFIVVFDDLFDEGKLDNRAEEMSACHEHLLAVIQNPPLATPSGPVARAFADLFRRASTAVSPAWRKRFEQHNAESFASQRWQVANRERHSLPDTQLYLQNRTHASGVLPVFDLIEVIQKREIPTEIYTSQPLQELLQAGNKIISWTNDVYSFKKDTACNDVNSLLMAIRREQCISLQEAVSYLCSMIEAETRRFQELRRLVPASAIDLHQYFDPLWVGIADWIRGHRDWYQGNKRYHEYSQGNNDPAELLPGATKRPFKIT